MKKLRNLMLMMLVLMTSANLLAQQSIYTESFENGVIPDNWTIYDLNKDFRVWEPDTRNAQSGEWSAAVSMNMDGTKNDWLITPLLKPTDENHTYSFWAKSQLPLPEMWEDFKVKVSTTGLEVADFTDLLGEEVEIPDEWIEYSYDLSNYIGQEIYVALVNESYNKSVLFADDFYAPILYYDDDMMVTDIAGPTMPLVGEYADYQITVKNNGWLAQGDYAVVLYQEDGSQITTVPGPELGSFEEGVVSISWAPEEEIATSIYAVVALNGDENPANDRSRDWYVSIHAPNLIEVTHGDFSGLEMAPLDFTMKTCLTETIYPAEVIGMMGNLTEITYSANFEYEIREKNIRVWIGETYQEELDMEWIPASELTLVYEGQITVPKGEWLIPLRLDQAYTYTGGNLVVMIEKELDNRAYGFANWFHATPANKLRTIQYINGYEMTDPDNPSLNPFWTSSKPFTPDIHLYFDMYNTGSLTGVVYDNQANPLEGVMIQPVNHMYQTFTNLNGEYDIPYIFSGDHSIAATKHGYFPAEGQVSVSNNQNATLDITLNTIPQVIVEGIVEGSDTQGVGIEGASVTLSGYENYTATTSGSGAFVLNNVYIENVYTLTIEADGYIAYQAEVEVLDDNLDLGTIVVNEPTPQPIQVTATDMEMMAGISWIEPNGLPETEFRYDDGQVVSQLGMGNFEHAVMGAVYPQNSIISSITWLLTDEDDHDVVKLFIFGLDMMGKPDETNIIFQSGEVPNVDNEWNVYELPELLDAPQGFFVGVCTPNKFTSIGIDDGMKDPYEFSFGTYYVTDDWTAGHEWMDIGEQEVFNNMMIRANGYSFGKIEKTGTGSAEGASVSFPLIKTEATIESPAQPVVQNGGDAKSLEAYQVFRLLKGDEAFEDRWTTLSTNFTSIWYDDPMWSAVEPGIYRYAVKAVYTNELLSLPRFSNELVKEEKTNVDFTITTNAGDAVTGANFLMQTEEGFGYSHFAILNETGTLSLTSVPKDTYKVEITLDGFEDFFAGNLVVECDTSFSFELIETFEPPFNPLVEVNGNDGSALFSWNNVPDAIFEDFESMENFSQDLGDWTTIDVDGMNTMYMDLFNYPFNGEPLGFISFNPQATEPAMWDIYAYSGERCAAAINADMAESDDWLISPVIDNVIDGTVFSFMARSTSEMWEQEWFRVGVSTSGTNPEDFTIISEGDFLTAPAWDWQEFSFDLSEYAGQQIYVAIQHISFESYVMLVDDLFIGMPENKQSRANTGFIVYLDGEEMGTTTDENFTFTDLNDGQDYVAGVIANYTTGSSEIVTVTFTAENQTSIVENNDIVASVYPNPCDGMFKIRLSSPQQAELTVYDLTGQKIHSSVTDGYETKVNMPVGSAGMYWVRLVQGDRISVKKIVIR